MWQIRWYHLQAPTATESARSAFGTRRIQLPGRVQRITCRAILASAGLLVERRDGPRRLSDVDYDDDDDDDNYLMSLFVLHFRTGRQ